MGGLAYNTIASMGRQVGEIIGIKGGGNWMREKFGWDPSLSFHPGAGGSMGFGAAFSQGGFVGLGSRAKSYFGFGYNQRGGMKSQSRYLETIFGGQKMINQASGRSFSGADLARGSFGRKHMAGMLREERAFSQNARRIFRNRRIAGGVGLAAGTVLASNTVGLGNVATLGIGAGGGAVLGGMIGRGVMGSKATTAQMAAGGGVGRRIGGKLGAGIAGLGIITGVL